MRSKTLKIHKNGSLEYITFPKLDNTGIVRNVFSTRLGGVSSGRYQSMNMSFSNGDERSNVLKNYEILCSSVGIDISHLVLSHQTHTNNVKIVTKDDLGTGVTKPSFDDIDGLITNEPGVALVTQYADCTPLLFCDPVKKVIAASHAGWRGTVKEIAKATVNKMQSAFNCNPSDIIACIGPCIGQCCYEVDDPVYNEFKKLSYLQMDKIFVNKDGGKYMLNLAEANKQIILATGIKPENIDITDLCTCCNHDELHSHRATHGMRGNMAAIIEII